METPALLLKFKGSQWQKNECRELSECLHMQLDWGITWTSIPCHISFNLKRLTDGLTLQSFSERLQESFELHFLHRSQNVSCVQSFPLGFHGKVVCTVRNKQEKKHLFIKEWCNGAFLNLIIRVQVRISWLRRCCFFLFGTVFIYVTTWIKFCESIFDYKLLFFILTRMLHTAQTHWQLGIWLSLLLSTR